MIGFSPIEPMLKRSLKSSPRTFPHGFPTRFHGASTAWQKSLVGEALSGRPLYVHLKGVDNVALKYAMNAKTRSCNTSIEAKFPRLRKRRDKMLNQIST